MTPRVALVLLRRDAVSARLGILPLAFADFRRFSLTAALRLAEDGGDPIR
jgi:hypothetical protein